MNETITWDIPGREDEMETRRALGLLIAVMASILVVLAGRSCARSIDDKNKESSKNRLNNVVPTVTVYVTVTGNAPAVEYEVQPPAETYNNDNVQPNSEISSDTENASEDTSLEAEAETSTKSMLDQFWDSKQPNYVDPYGRLEKSQTPSSVRIEIG